jgi:hypothetical protein
VDFKLLAVGTSKVSIASSNFELMAGTSPATLARKPARELCNKEDCSFQRSTSYSMDEIAHSVQFGRNASGMTSTFEGSALSAA